MKPGAIRSDGMRSDAPKGQSIKAQGNALGIMYYAKFRIRQTCFRVTHASRVLRPASRRTPVFGLGRDAQAGTRDACVTPIRLLKKTKNFMLQITRLDWIMPLAFQTEAQPITSNCTP